MSDYAGGSETRTGPKQQRSSGIFLGKVISHLDQTFMGNIEVEILKTTDAGNLTDYVQCKYASPFLGTTPIAGLTKNDAYEYTQKSYGFWAVPPDVGTMVLVVMPEGNYGSAYWIGCVPERGANFMLPGYAATTFNNSDKSTPTPVGEYNKAQEKGSGKDPTKFIKPANTKAVERLKTAGLEKDQIRGTTTSSARREAPSMVFGWSTPGPLDFNGPKAAYGRPGEQIQRPFNRLGGSSFVMDDGDMSLLRTKKASEGKVEYKYVDAGEKGGDVTLPANDLVRIQTRSGHQILLHNTEDLIYIAHGSGNSWIEMTANGKIDIYSKDSISVRSENDINFSAERDINFHAGKNFNFTAGENAFVTAGKNIELRAEADGRIFAGANTHIKSKNHYEKADSINMNSSVGAAEAVAASLPARTPTHEPYTDHENYDPTKYTAEKTIAIAADKKKGNFDNGASEKAAEITLITDTFKRSVT